MLLIFVKAVRRNEWVKAPIGEVQIETQHKKPKQQELTREQKEENKQLSVKRIIVEHVIRLVKIFRVAQERFRLRGCL